MSKHIQLFLLTLITSFYLQGCATTGGSTDPTQVGLVDGFTYKVGQNEKLENEIKRRQGKSAHLEAELQDSKEKLNSSDKKLKSLEKRLAKTRHKTKASKNKARKIRVELQLKKQDLRTKSNELAELERRIKTLKNTKASNKDTLVRIIQTENDLKSTKKEIAILTDYLKDDLFIRAENSLHYD